MNKLGRIGMVLGMALIFLPLALGQGEAPRRVDAAAGHAVVRVLTERVRFERRSGADGGACASIEVADLRVRLRGSAVVDPSRIFLEREQRPAIHALLVDTSASLEGDLEAVRRIARRYVEQLDLDRDRAMMLTFDDEPQMFAPITGDRGELLRAVADLHAGGSTVLHDALIAAGELLARADERGILVVITDGLDRGSLADRDLVRQAILREGGPAVFVIAFKVPPIVAVGPAGLNSTRKFLQGLAHDSGGVFVEAIHDSRLLPLLERVQELIASEAEVQVVDPQPEAPPAPLKLETRRPGCRIRRLEVTRRRSDGGWVAALDAASTSAALPDDPFRDRVVRRQRAVADPSCGEARGASFIGRLTDDGRELSLCLWSETMDVGKLYDPFSTLSASNPWPGAKVRALTVPLPRISSLSRDPIDGIALAAEQAWLRREEFIERDSRQRPASWHARPFHDQPLLVGPRTFSLLSTAVARAMAQRTDYREWLARIVGQECEQKLLRLERGLARGMPESSSSELRQMLQGTPEAQRLAARAANPTVRDAERHFGVWLGDLSAQEALARWEARSANEILIAPGTEKSASRFVESWLALRALVWVPSYVRALGLLVPVRDDAEGRVGFWRILPPRLALLEARKRGPDPRDLPFDLVPDQPHGFEYLREVLAHDRGLAEALSHGRWRVDTIRYASRQKPYRQDPNSAFVRSTVRIALVRASANVTLDVDVSSPRSADHRSDRVRRVLSAVEFSEDAGAAGLGQRFAAASPTPPSPLQPVAR